MSRIIFVDIDETLFFTSAKILVTKDNKIVKSLSNQEFNTYTLSEDESFDFRQFKCSKTFTDTSKPNHKMIKRVKKLLKMGEEVCLLTARADFDNKNNIIDYLNNYGLDIGHYKDGKVHIIRCGNKPGKSAVRKKEVVEKILSQRAEVDQIVLYDDCIDNLLSIKSLNVEVTTYMVQRDKIEYYK